MELKQIREQLLMQVEHLVKNKLQGIFGGNFLVERGLRDQDFSVTSKGWEVVRQNQFEIVRCIAHLSTLSRSIEELREDCNFSEIVQTVVDDVESLKDQMGIAGLVYDGSAGHRCTFEILSIRSAISGLIRICSDLESGNGSRKISLNLNQHSPTRLRLWISGGETQWQASQSGERFNLSRDELENCLKSEALVMEWKIANYVVALDGGSISVSQNAERRFGLAVELPLVVE
jgi:hypothetical protein